MPDNQGNPYDEILKNIRKVMEELMKDLNRAGDHRIVGYTIVVGPDSMVHAIRPDIVNMAGMECELVETEDWIFIAAELPPDLPAAPEVDIQPEEVRIRIGSVMKQVPLPARIDIKHSFYDIHRRVLDIACRKA